MKIKLNRLLGYLNIQVYIIFITIPLLLMSILNFLEVKYGSMVDSGHNTKFIKIISIIILISFVLYLFTITFKFMNNRLINKVEVKEGIKNNEAEKILENIANELIIIQISLYLFLGFIVYYIYQFMHIVLSSR